MDQMKTACRQALIDEAVECLNRYSDFSSTYQVSFSKTEPKAGGLPWIAARLTRPDGKSFAESGDPMDQKFLHLKDQTALVRPFFQPMTEAEWDDSDWNAFPVVNFDYAAILGYDRQPDGTYFLKALYYPPTDALVDGKAPDEDGVWRKLPLATYYVHQLSLDPRKKFAKFLYLAERMSEGLEYQYDKMGYFYSQKA